MKKMNLVKRMAIVAMASLMAITSLTTAVPVSASSGTGIESQKDCSVKEYSADATVTASSANVREGAGTEFRVVNTFNKGNYNVESGKVMTVSGVKNYLALRSEASSSDKAEIARLYNGYKVTVLKTEGEYAYVWSSNLGLTGFVKAAYLK